MFTRFQNAEQNASGGFNKPKTTLDSRDTMLPKAHPPNAHEFHDREYSASRRRNHFDR